MHSRLQNRMLALFVAAVIGAFFLPSVLGRANPTPQAPSDMAIACRVLEVHTSPQQQITVVVFHQQDQKDGARLGALLRRHSEASVEFQTADGAWHPATVMRLKSCFGRGLLLFPSSVTQLTGGAGFILQFPPN